METDEAGLKHWFCGSVLVHEAALLRYIRRNLRDASEAHDILQEVYVAMIKTAQSGLPDDTAAYLFRATRNMLINHARRGRIVSFEQISDLEALPAAIDFGATERHLDSREGLRRAQAGLEALPPRCREVVRLRKIERLTTREAAVRLGVTVNTIERQLSLGMRAMTDFMLGGEGKIDRGGKAERANRETKRSKGHA